VGWLSVEWHSKILQRRPQPQRARTPAGGLANRAKSEIQERSALAKTVQLKTETSRSVSRRDRSSSADETSCAEMIGRGRESCEESIQVSDGSAHAPTDASSSISPGCDDSYVRKS